MQASEHTRHMKDVHHELTLGLPHYPCGVVTGTVAVGNKMQLFSSCMISFFIRCNEYRLKVLLKIHGLTKYAMIALCC